MSLFGDAGREFIAWPDQTKDQILFKWPDTNIRVGTQLTVEQDEVAVFFRSGQVRGVFGPGRHTLQSTEVPFLSDLLDAATGGRFLITEIYFVASREFPNLPFGGAVDNVVDPDTKLAVGLRVFGDYSLKVSNPPALILNLAGTQNLTTNDQVTDWMREQLLKVLRTSVVAHITNDNWPVLGIAARNGDIEQEVLGKVQELIAPYGISITRLGNFTVSLKPEDETTLKNYRAQVEYTKLAGSFQQAAAAEALEGIGQGAANGGGAANPAVFGVGLGLGGYMANPNQAPAQTPAPSQPAQPAAPAPPIAAAQPAPSAPPAPLGVRCATCNTFNPQGAKFCFNCGKPFAATQ